MCFIDSYLCSTLSYFQCNTWVVVGLGESWWQSEPNPSVIPPHLAVVEGIRTFRVYLEGRQFQVQTDHRSLQYLNQMRDHNGRLARWSLYLQPFDFVIAHRPGKHNGNADGLSRAPTTSIFEGGGDVRDH